jgi:DNA/RNA-binding domain of Phe-tRNA-synthetase-like protein
LADEEREEMMLLELDAQVRTRIPGVIFGCALFHGLQVREGDEDLWGQMEEACQRLAREYTLEGLSEYTRIAAARSLQKSFGFDPTRYRPSSEALLRRVLKGQGLYQINTAVDVNNLCSLEFLLPMCVYDLRHVRGQLCVRIGRPGESYPGIGRQTFVIENRVIIADAEGVVGNTVSDSERTKVSGATTDMLLAIYGPAGSNEQQMQQQLTLACERMTHFNGGHTSGIQVLTA